ncbi:MAG TPA: hypothetical protein VFB08_15270 [Burkholderiales bacterium]|nr:hypothetical protein [Burkholderiales bacterium]
MLGLCASAAIYLTASDDANAELERLRASKMYRHEIEHFGGKMALLFEDLSQWLGHLWHGTTLAFTVAWLSFGTAAVLFLVARALDERE